MPRNSFRGTARCAGFLAAALLSVLASVAVAGGSVTATPSAAHVVPLCGNEPPCMDPIDPL